MDGSPERGPRDVVRRWDRVFDALSSEPRRQIVVELLDVPVGRSVPLPDVAVNPNLPMDSERLRLRLRHQHLPKLAEYGYVEWDDDPLCASRGPEFEEVGVVFESLYANAGALPDRLVVGCRTLEQEQRGRDSGSGLKG
jgi:hypothetical protein